ncbi:amidase [Haloechinothrix salitolerans]|uniref:Amidase n=1 Tax=Haloechinothrix salitolerans TaxID=926830 RepID=A0ABW2BWH5_9PSEU
MTETRVHAFTDDVLGEDDAVGIAARIASGEVSPREVIDAAIARTQRVDETLNAVTYSAYEWARNAAPATGSLSGVPTFVKDNTDVAGMPTGFGTVAFRARPATKNGPFTGQFLGTGLTVLGKSRLPEFGFNASTEFAEGEPTRNPWHTDFSSGASSGGSAALVASGAVPIAHANDGGGSIRIPAACCGLVGLKPSRGRFIDGDQARTLPINLIGEGVVTRSVRDTAAFFAAAEKYRPAPKLPPVGHVEGPSGRTLRIGLLLESVSGARTCPETRAAVEDTAAVLEKLGHHVEPVPLPVDAGFVRDFTRYWGMLSFMVSRFGRFVIDRDFDASKMDNLSRGLHDLYQRELHRTPTTLYRLAKIKRAYAAAFARHDLILSPVLAHVTPKLGHLSPTLPFGELLERLQQYVAFTPLNNVSGGPAISLPMGASEEGLPIGVQFSAAVGDERTLLDVAYALEQERPFRRIQD